LPLSLVTVLQHPFHKNAALPKLKLLHISHLGNIQAFRKLRANLRGIAVYRLPSRKKDSNCPILRMAAASVLDVATVSAPANARFA
jgi:hypothetical protein